LGDLFLDDVIVTGKTFDDMVSNLDTVLGRLSEAGLKLKDINKLNSGSLTTQNQSQWQ